MLYVVKEYLPTTDYLTCIDKCIILTTTQIAIIGGWCRVSRHMAWLAEHPALRAAADRQLKAVHASLGGGPPGSAHASVAPLGGPSTDERTTAEWLDDAARRRSHTPNATLPSCLPRPPPHTPHTPPPGTPHCSSHRAVLRGRKRRPTRCY